MIEFIYLVTYVTNKEKGDMNLRESNEGYMGRVGAMKGKGLKQCSSILI